jgi:hypothetical protein
MSSHTSSLLPWPKPQDLALVGLGFVLYLMSYELHRVLLPYVAYVQGVDLLFLPAGIKLVMVMIGGWRGALGCGLALLVMTNHVWPELSPPLQVVYAALSAGVTWLVVRQMFKHKALGQSLEGLCFWDIVHIDAINTLLHGLVLNSFFWLLGNRTAETLPSSVLAMAFGDFLGTGVVLVLVLAVDRVLRLSTQK